MTTIAYKDGVLAADTQVNDGNLRVASLKKIGSLPGGWRWAYAGAVQFQEDCVRWAKTYAVLKRSESTPPTWDDESSVFIVIDSAGEAREWLGKGWVAVCSPAAWGSGQAVARGAMYVGASAEDAVKAAIALDMRSGGDVTVLA
jgi:ATP-dependent HslUV protease subunit HslV